MPASFSLIAAAHSVGSSPDLASILFNAACTAAASSALGTLPAATPNPLMVQLADDMLNRGGRMVDAVRAIGPGTYTYPNPPYELTVRRR